MFVCDNCDRTCPEQWRNRHEGQSFCDDCFEDMDVEDEEDDDDDSGAPSGYPYMARTPTWGSGNGTNDSGPWGKRIAEQLPPAEHIAAGKEFECPTCEQTVSYSGRLDLDPHDILELDCAECEQWKAWYNLTDHGASDIEVNVVGEENVEEALEYADIDAEEIIEELEEDDG